jgi:hypothetical protein
LGRAVAKEERGRVQPLAVEIVEANGGQIDACNELVPVEADLEQAMERPWSPKMFD